MSRSKNFSIDNLLVNLTSPAMTNQFKVDFIGPTIFRTKNTETSTRAVYGDTQEYKGKQMDDIVSISKNNQRDIGLSLRGVRCRSAQLPSRTIETELYSPVGKGKPTPTGVVSDAHSMDISFYCDTDFIDRKILQMWMDYIVTTDTGATSGGDELYVSYERNSKPVFQYPKSYMGTVIIEHLRRDDDRLLENGTHTVRNTLHNAFPSAISAQELSMDNSDILLFTVTMSFQHFTTRYGEPQEAGNLSELHRVYNGTDKVSPRGLNSGRRRFDGILEGLGLAAQFGDDGAEKLLKKFNKYDTQISRLNNSLRDFGSLFGG